MSKSRVVDRQTVAIRWMSVLLAVCIVLMGMMFYKMSNLPEQFTAYYPPDLSVGGKQKVNTTPKHIVYSFAYRFWQRTERCLSTCSEETVLNVKRHEDYMTRNHYDKRLAKAQVRAQSHSSVTRTIEEYEGYSSKKVRVIAPGVWEVTLKLFVEDRIGNNVFDDRALEYTIRVVAKDIGINVNPWRLALDGLAGNAKRIQTVKDKS
jgi:hypothetical protein